MYFLASNCLETLAVLYEKIKRNIHLNIDLPGVMKTVLANIL